MCTAAERLQLEGGAEDAAFSGIQRVCSITSLFQDELTLTCGTAALLGWNSPLVF